MLYSSCQGRQIKDKYWWINIFYQVEIIAVGVYGKIRLASAGSSLARWTVYFRWFLVGYCAWRVFGRTFPDLAEAQCIRILKKGSFHNYSWFGTYRPLVLYCCRTTRSIWALQVAQIPRHHSVYEWSGWKLRASSWVMHLQPGILKIIVQFQQQQKSRMINEMTDHFDKFHHVFLRALLRRKWGRITWGNGSNSEVITAELFCSLNFIIFSQLQRTNVKSSFNDSEKKSHLTTL